jgi:sugar phosphate isomerase/epimerase
MSERIEKFNILSDFAISKKNLGEKENKDKRLISEMNFQSENLGFSFKERTLFHILEIAEKESSLKNLIGKNPYLLMKFGWTYEHAPNFTFFNKNIEPSKINEFICQFAVEHEEAMGKIEKEIEINEPKEKIEAVEAAFWKKGINPIEDIKQAIEKGLTGIELAVDFHPFNGSKLMLQEYAPEMRKKIKEIVERYNFIILLHSSVIGPYGKDGQVFFDMTEHTEVCKETIELSKDIGAKSIVFHITDLNKLEQLAEIVKFAKGSEVKIAFENTWTKEGKMHSSGDFLETMNKIYEKLDDKERKNLAITFDAAYHNLANEDPVVSLLEVINWCCEKNVALNKLHLNMNYGLLPFYKSFSADVHNSISSCGPINN